MPELFSSRYYLFIFLLLTALTICVPASAREYISIRQSVLTEPIVDPAKYHIKDEVVVFDLWKYFDQAGIKETTERADVIYLLTSLQGIVNRERPRLFVIASLALFDVEKRVHNDPQYKEKPVTDLDAFWLAELQRKGYITRMRRTSDLADLIRTYRKELSGLALWEMKVPATANAALMAAGCDNLLPVSSDLGSGRLRKWMTEKFPDLKVKIDLTNRFNGTDPIKFSGKSFPSTGSAKNDVYRFIIEKYQKPGLTNPFYMWYNCDGAMWGAQRNHYAASIYGYLGDRNEIQQNGMYNADYWVAKRAFILDLLPWGDTTPNDDPKQKVGTDRSTWNDILQNSYTQRKGEFGEVGGFPSWWNKYTNVVGDKHECVPTEWEFISLISSYNMVNEGDAAFGISNASFYMHLPQMTPEEVKITPSPDVQYKDGTTYIAFCMLDYDGSAWTNQMVPSIYNDPERGKVPLNWCINPIIHRRIPHAMRYLYEHRTPMDFFGLSDDGAGYLNPLQLIERQGRVKESGVYEYERFAKTLHKRYGIDHTAFYISTRFAPSWTEMVAQIDKGFGYGLPIQQQLVNGIPVSFVQTFHISQQKDFEAEMRRVFAESVNHKGYSPIFKTYRCILITPGMITGIIDKLRKEYPDAKVEITDLRNYYRLLGQKLRSPLKSPYENASEVTAQPDAHQGLNAIPSSGGYFEIQTMQGSKVWSLKQMQHGLFLCIDVDDAFAQQITGKPIEIEVEYLDRGTGTIELQYDSLDPAALLDGAYKNARPKIELTDSGEWRTAKIRVDDPRLSNRQNDGTDFRFAKDQNDTLVIRRVTLRPLTQD